MGPTQEPALVTGQPSSSISSPGFLSPAVSGELGALSGQGTELGWRRRDRRAPGGRGRGSDCGGQPPSQHGVRRKQEGLDGRGLGTQACQDTGMSGRPARSLGLRKHRPSRRGGRKSKVTGQLRWFRPGAQRDSPSLGAILASGTCRQSSARRPSLPHVTWWAVCPDSPLKRTPVAGLGPTRGQGDVLSVLSFVTPRRYRFITRPPGESNTPNTHQETPGPTTHKDRADLTKEGVPARHETDEPGDRAPRQRSQIRKHRRRVSPGTRGVRAVKFTETEQTVRAGAGGGAGLCKMNPSWRRTG